MITLYMSVFSLVSLLFDYINYTYPDALNSYIDPYSGSMRYSIASLFVLFPLLLVLMRLIRKDIAVDHTKKDIWVRRWFLVLTLFVAGATIAIDLITLINYFLGGEITMRFILKVLVVLLVAGGGFLHFLADLRGYWIRFPEKAAMVGWGAGVLVIASIVAGFFIMGTPGQIRLYRLDDQKIGDLTSIQWQVVNYYQQKQKLPMSLADLADPISGFSVPVDPQTAAAYRYEATGALAFKLCANFNAESHSTDKQRIAHPVSTSYSEGPADLENQTWQHVAGDVCFERTIDPERYPPFKK